MVTLTILRSSAMAGVLATLAIAGCETTQTVDREWLFFPAPPVPPRVQFLTWFSGADQVEPTRTSLDDFILGEEPLAHRALNKPYGIAVRDGVAYVCDTKGLALCRLDFVNQTYSVLGVRGPGRLRKPLNVAVDRIGFKFVVDSVRQQIVVFGPDDKYVKAFDIPAPCHPVDVAIHENKLYVLDNDETCRIVVLDRSTGELLGEIGGPGGEPGQFKIPNSLATTPEGDLVVSDTHNWRIQKLTIEGESIWVKGTAGRSLGNFGRPRGIRVGPDGIIYVVDASTEIVQMFSEEGQILMRFGGPGDAPGALGLPSQIAIDKTSIPYFQKYIHPDFNAQYLLFVVSQFGARLVNVYAFGSFPEGYELAESSIDALPVVPPEEGIGPVAEDAEVPRLSMPTTTQHSSPGVVKQSGPRDGDLEDDDAKQGGDEKD